MKPKYIVVAFMSPTQKLFFIKKSDAVREYNTYKKNKVKVWLFELQELTP